MPTAASSFCSSVDIQQRETDRYRHVKREREDTQTKRITDRQKETDKQTHRVNVVPPLFVCLLVCLFKNFMTFLPQWLDWVSVLHRGHVACVSICVFVMHQFSCKWGGSKWPGTALSAYSKWCCSWTPCHASLMTGSNRISPWQHYNRQSQINTTHIITQGCSDKGHKRLTLAGWDPVTVLLYGL